MPTSCTSPTRAVCSRTHGRRLLPGMFRMTVDPEEAPDEPEWVTVGFRRATRSASTAMSLALSSCSRSSTELGGRHGVGRVDIVENRFVGMKNRGVYETPGRHDPVSRPPGRRVDHPRPRGCPPARRTRAAIRRDGLQRLLVLARSVRHSRRSWTTCRSGSTARRGSSSTKARRSSRGAGPTVTASTTRRRHLRSGRRVQPGRRHRVHPSPDAAAADVRGSAASERASEHRDARTPALGRADPSRMTVWRERSMTLWGGRFRASPDEALWRFTVDTSDRRLLVVDIVGSLAHVDDARRGRVARRPGRGRPDGRPRSAILAEAR